MYNSTMRVGKIGLLIVGGLIILVGGVGYFFRAKVKPDLTNSPQFIQADFIDLSKIYSISKFRSGSGHDFSSSGETCRSMKHYFNVQDSKEKFAAWDQNNNLPPPPTPGNAIDIFAPVDGKIIKIEEDQMPIGKQIYITPSAAPQFTVRLFHIYPITGISTGTKVTAGQKIGEIGVYQNTDIAIQAGGFGRSFISYFEVMPDSVFARYQARGATSRDDFIITKEYRDAHPLECNGEQFSNNQDGDSAADSENFVRLSGWQNPR